MLDPLPLVRGVDELPVESLVDGAEGENARQLQLRTTSKSLARPPGSYKKCVRGASFPGQAIQARWIP